MLIRIDPHHALEKQNKPPLITPGQTLNPILQQGKVQSPCFSRTPGKGYEETISLFKMVLRVIESAFFRTWKSFSGWETIVEGSEAGS